MAARGRVFGSAGASLNDFNSWGSGDGSAAKRGQKGEVATAEMLNALADREGGPTVLHDLRIPLKGIKANIDHAVVSGKNVLLIDSKVWKPGFYWTVGGKSRRGFERVPHTEKKTMEMASQGISGLLASSGVNANIVTPVVAVWPSSDKAKLSLWALKFPGARVIRADQLAGRAGVGAVLSSKPWKKWAEDTADPAIVNALLPLLNR